MLSQAPCLVDRFPRRPVVARGPKCRADQSSEVALCQAREIRSVGPDRRYGRFAAMPGLILPARVQRTCRGESGRLLLNLALKQAARTRSRDRPGQKRVPAP
jgi:hypothetical protein